MKFEYGGNVYEVVDYIPLGYEVWNIGRHAPPGYVPLCLLSARQPFDGARNIDVGTLKALPIKIAEKLLSESVVKQYRNNNGSEVFWRLL